MTAEGTEGQVGQCWDLLMGDGLLVGRWIIIDIDDGSLGVTLMYMYSRQVFPELEFYPARRNILSTCGKVVHAEGGDSEKGNQIDVVKTGHTGRGYTLWID